MRSTHRGRLSSVILACLFLSSVLAQDQSRTRPTATSDDDAALRALVDEFYGSYAKKDLAGFIRLWSAKSPELATRRETMQKLFVDVEKIEVKDLVIRKTAIEGEKAKLRVELEMDAIEVKTSKPAANLGKMVRALECVREEGGWKVWHETAAEEDLATALALLKTDAERSALLTAEKDLVTEKLVREMNQQGLGLLSRGNYPEALARFSIAQKIAEEIGDKEGIARAILGIANVRYRLSNYAQALEDFQKSLTLSEGIGDKATISNAMRGIGNVHYSRGEYARALEFYQKGLMLNEALGDNVGVGRLLINIGNVHYQQGNYGPALECFKKSLSLTEPLGDKDLISRALNAIGVVYYNQGDFGPALEYMQKSLALAEALGDKPGASGTLNNIGNIYHQQSNYGQALEYYQRSLAMKEALGDKSGVAMVLNNIGNVHYSQKDYAKALEFYQKRLTMSESLGDKPGIAVTLDMIGVTHYAQGNYAQALEYCQKSLTLAEEMVDKYRITNSLIGLANASRLQGNYTQALDFANRAMVRAKEFGDANLFWRAQTTAGRSYRGLNQLTAARRAFEEAITAIETSRAQVVGGEQDLSRYFSDKLSPYYAMIELLVTQKQFDAALGYAERAKARVLVDVLRNGRIDVTKAMTAAEQDQERGFNKQLVSLNEEISRENQRVQPDQARLNDLKAQLQKVRLGYEAFQTSLYAAHPELKTQRGEIEALTPEQARALLPDSRSALLEYVVADEQAYLFVLTVNAAGTTTDLKVYPLAIKQKELEDRVAQYRATLASGSPGFRQPAGELYELLLKPAAAQLQGRTALVIVPDGALWELPFQTLQSGPNRYLIEDAAIAYAPSLTALREMNKLRDGRKDSAGSATLLAFGNPALGEQTVTRVKSVLMDEKLEPLPEAERQVTAIRQIYGAAKSKVYIGAEASEEHAKAEAGSYRILHFATHGILNDSSPMYSQLLLAQSAGNRSEDGLLEAWEIMKLDLNADLVVLSACETARGQVGTGEGMIGLSWALFIAGSPTSILSQWKVDAASTTELMVEFHRQLKAQMAKPGDSFSAARALREAELKLLRSERYRHPFYWAGFVVTGKGF